MCPISMRAETENIGMLLVNYFFPLVSFNFYVSNTRCCVLTTVFGRGIFKVDPIFIFLNSSGFETKYFYIYLLNIKLLFFFHSYIDFLYFLFINIYKWFNPKLIFKLTYNNDNKIFIFVIFIFFILENRKNCE